MEHKRATVIFNVEVDEHTPEGLSWFELADLGCVYIHETTFPQDSDLECMFVPMRRRADDDPYVIMIHAVIER